MKVVTAFCLSLLVAVVATGTSTPTSRSGTLITPNTFPPFKFSQKSFEDMAEAFAVIGDIKTGGLDKIPPQSLNVEKYKGRVQCVLSGLSVTEPEKWPGNGGGACRTCKEIHGYTYVWAPATSPETTKIGCARGKTEKDCLKRILEEMEGDIPFYYRCELVPPHQGPVRILYDRDGGRKEEALAGCNYAEVRSQDIFFCMGKWRGREGHPSEHGATNSGKTEWFDVDVGTAAYTLREVISALTGETLPFIPQSKIVKRYVAGEIHPDDREGGEEEDVVVVEERMFRSEAPRLETTVKEKEKETVIDSRSSIIMDLVSKVMNGTSLTELAESTPPTPSIPSRSTRPATASTPTSASVPPTRSVPSATMPTTTPSSTQPTPTTVPGTPTVPTTPTIPTIHTTPTTPTVPTTPSSPSTSRVGGSQSLDIASTSFMPPETVIIPPTVRQPSTATPPNTIYPSTMQPNVVPPTVGQPTVAQPSTTHSRTIQPNNIQPNNIQPNNIQPNNLQPNNIQPNNIQPNNIQPNNIHPSSIQPNGIPGTVNGPSILPSTGVPPSVLQSTIRQPPIKHEL